MATEALLSLRLPRCSPESTHPPRGERWPARIGTKLAKNSSRETFRRVFAKGRMRSLKAGEGPAKCGVGWRLIPEPKTSPYFVVTPANQRGYINRKDKEPRRKVGRNEVEPNATRS